MCSYTNTTDQKDPHVLSDKIKFTYFFSLVKLGRSFQLEFEIINEG
jgi:hypothetical protein